MKFITLLLFTLSLSIPTIAVSADKVECQPEKVVVEKKDETPKKKKHKKYEGTKVPEKK